MGSERAGALEVTVQADFILRWESGGGFRQEHDRICVPVLREKPSTAPGTGSFDKSQHLCSTYTRCSADEAKYPPEDPPPPEPRGRGAPNPIILKALMLCSPLRWNRKEGITPKPPVFLSSPDVYLRNSTHIQFMLLFFFLGPWIQVEEEG